MNLFKRMVVVLGLVLTLIVPVQVPVQAQTIINDGTTLKQIIIFGRHSIRSSTGDPSTIGPFCSRSLPPLL